MSFTNTYGRALALVARNRRAIALLAAGNLGVAALQFLDPLLFGRVIGLLARTDTTPHATLFHEGAILIGTWLAIGALGISTVLYILVGATARAWGRSGAASTMCWRCRVRSTAACSRAAC